MGDFKEELFNEARRILAKVLKIDKNEIKMESKLQDDLGIDSVDFWDIMAGFDKKFGVKIPVDEVSSLNTVDDLVNSLARKIRV